MIRYSVILAFTMLLLFTSCQNQTEEQTADLSEFELPQDFIEFYEQFHLDSAFQLAHIEFPLPGLPAYADKSDPDVHNFFWQKEDWVIHTPLDEETSGFRREIFTMGETLVVEYMIHNYNYRIQRRFSKRNNIWKLSYYEDVNQIGAQR